MSTIPPQSIYIYGLRCPISGQIRYVGKTVDPTNRLRQHVRDRHDSYKTRWLHIVSAAGLTPTLEILETVPYAEWREAERRWIAQLRSEGHRLTNTLTGGYGPDLFPPELRQRLSATHRARMATIDAATRRAFATRGGVASGPARKGKPLHAAHRAAITQAHRSRTITDEERQARSLRSRAAWARLTPEERTRRREARMGHAVSRETAEHISQALIGKPVAPERISTMRAGLQQWRSSLSEEALADHIRKQHPHGVIRKGKRSSRFIGVSWWNVGQRWRVRFGHNKRYYYVGYFTDETEAARAYDAKAREVFGPNARLNFPDSD